MTRMILKRLGQGLLVLLVLETVTFFLIRLLPGHPFMGEKKLPEHVLQQLQASYGLDQPSLVQYGRYWWNMLAHGDLGPSLVKEGVSVADMIGQSFPVSLQLGVIGMAISILAGIPAGIVAALYKNRWMDWWVMLVSMAGICIPAFVVAPVLGVALGMHVPGLSVAGWDSPGCVVLPALTLGLVNAAYLARLTRGGDPMRAYIHEQTAQKLPTLTRACALFAVLAAAGQGSVVFANGAQILLGAHGIFILLEIFSAAAFAAAAAFSRRMRWEKE